MTGSGRRLGRQIALTLASRGAAVLLHYHRSKREVFELKKEIEASGGRAFPVMADFSCRREPMAGTVKFFVGEVFKRVPRIDILINNASVFYPAPFGKISEKSWDEFMTVNLKVPFFLSQEIGRRMLRRKAGVIINLADASVFRPSPRYLPYAISKAGLAAATAGLARALAPYVRVNGIAPGPILPAEGSSGRQNREAARRTLLKRFGEPGDIAETVRFLCEDAPFITGALIPVDGGALIA